jgi:hypothetical protein
MFTTLALAAALVYAPSQTGTLSLTNVRVTNGSQFGPVRTDNKFLPGELFFITFDIENLKANADGRINYDIQMEVTDKSGKTVYKQPPSDQLAQMFLGGSKLPAFAMIALGDEQQPGVYSCKVTVTDKLANASQSLERQIELLPKNFGIVALYMSPDPRGELAVPPTGIVGQSVWLHFGVVGFGRNTQTKQPDVVVTMTIFDEANKPTMPKPEVVKVKAAEEKHFGIPIYYFLPLNRAGKFTVKIEAVDLLANKTSTYTLTLSVVEPPK